MYSLKVDVAGYAPSCSTRHPGHRATSNVDHHEASSLPIFPAQSCGVQAETVDVTMGRQNPETDGPLLEQEYDMEVCNGATHQAGQRQCCQDRHTLGAKAS